jgi:hypothetical protein
MNLFEQQSNEFVKRHIGPSEADTIKMLKKLVPSLLNNSSTIQFRHLFVWKNH